MGLNTSLLIIAVVVIVVAYFHGRNLERNIDQTPAGRALRAGYDAEVADMRDEYATNARRTAERVETDIPLLVQQVYERAVYDVAAQYGDMSPVPPPVARSQADMRAARLARQAERETYGDPVDLDTLPPPVVSPVADEWATMRAELVGDDTPTEPIPVGPLWWVVTSNVTTDTQWADTAADAERMHCECHPDAMVTSAVPAALK